jgi:hypothetical protein
MESWIEATTLSDRYEYRFWDDDSIRELLPRVALPKIQAIYERLPETLHGIRADIARLVVLFHFGGVYADADTRVLKARALLDHFEAALRCGADVVVGTADLHGCTRRWIEAMRRPSNFLLGSAPGSAFIGRYLASISNDFERLRIGDKLRRIENRSPFYILRLTKAWTGPRKLRTLLRSTGRPSTIRLTPVGFVASGYQKCFPDAVLAHDYKASWYPKSKKWAAVRDWTVYSLLSAPLDAWILGLGLSSLLLLLASR